MINLLLRTNPLLVFGGALLLALGAKVYFLSAKVDVLTAQLDEVRLRLDVCQASASGLADSVARSNAEVLRLGEVAKRRKGAYERLSQRIERDEIAHQNSISVLRAEVGQSCRDGIALIDKELGLK